MHAFFIHPIIFENSYQIQINPILIVWIMTNVLTCTSIAEQTIQQCKWQSWVIF